jgi:HlyD family secretion protein
VNQKRAAYDLVLKQLEDLKVKAGMHGVLQLLPVEEGASVQANQQVARVADPTVLKAELRIAETQTKMSDRMTWSPGCRPSRTSI